MKKFVVIAAVALIAFAGCNQAASLIQPIIGSWTASVLGVPLTLTLNADKTCTQTTTLAGIGVTKNGDWDSDDSTITMSWDDGSSDTEYYTFNSDNSQMSLSSSPDGIAITYDRD